MTKERLPWFHCYPTLWLGALQEMPPDLGYLYVITCLRIYERRGPVPDDARALGRRVGFRESHARRLIDELLSVGKLQRVDGGLMNPFAEEMIRDGEEIVSRTRKVRSAAAKISWEKRKQKQGRTDTRAKQKDADLDLDKDSESKIKSLVRAKRDDWPEDYVEQFWNRYPKARRTARKTVASKLAALRAGGEVDWAKLMAGLDRYNATDDVARGFACAPVVWINGGRWMDEVQKGGSNGKADHGRSGRVDPVAAAAARMAGRLGGNGAASGAAAPVQPAEGLAGYGGGARRGDEPAFDLDLRAEPGGDVPRRDRH